MSSVTVVMIFHILVTHVLISEKLLQSITANKSGLGAAMLRQGVRNENWGESVETQNVCHNSLNNLLISWKRFN